MDLNFKKTKSKDLNLAAPKRRGRDGKWKPLWRAVCDLKRGEALTIPVPEEYLAQKNKRTGKNNSVDDFRNFLSASIATTVRGMYMRRTNVESRVDMDVDFKVRIVADEKNTVAIVCVANKWTQEDEDQQKQRTEKRNATQKANKKTAKKSEPEPEEVEEEEEETLDDDEDFDDDESDTDSDESDDSSDDDDDDDFDIDED